MNKQTINELVRDLTQVSPRSKSEVRKMLEELVRQAKREVVEEIKKAILKVEKTCLMSSSDMNNKSFIPPHLFAEMVKEEVRKSLLITGKDHG